MKVATVFGTRPEIIRLSRVIASLDRSVQHVLIHTGQNYDPNLSDRFFDELAVRPPDVSLGAHATAFADQAGQILSRVAEAFSRERPERLLVLGDTNSGLAAIVAARMRIPVFHMEAGNRCYDDRVPEEINRRIIDHCSDVLMPYTHRSKENLVREGIERRRIFVTGNPIYEVLEHYREQIDGSDVLERYDLQPQHFFLVTLHRAENVDDAMRLQSFLTGLSEVADEYDWPMVVSVHPRTADKMARFGLRPSSERLKLVDPLGFLDFVKLEKNAACVLSDSGTVQEECCIFRVPNVTLRDVTERPETVECGSNIITGAEPATILRSVAMALDRRHPWDIPEEYVVRDVSSTVRNIVAGYSCGR